MDRISTILKFEWRAYWRRVRGAGNFRTSNLGVLVLFGGLAVVKYFQQLPIAAAQIEKGTTTRYQALLLVVFLTLMFPIGGESRRSISSRGLLHFPLTINELFLIRLGSAFYSPISWAIVAASLALVYPVSVAWHPLTGAIALLLFFLFALFTSLTITHLLNNRVARRVALVVLLVVSSLGALLWLGKGTDLLPSSLSWLSPVQLAAAAAVSPSPWRSLSVLVAITVLMTLLAVWTFAPTLQPRQDRRSRRFVVFGSVRLPGKFGGLLKKDLRYWTRLLDLYLTLPVVVFFNMYLLSDTAPSAVVLAIIVGVLFLPCMSVAFNCFGLDSPLGLDRYTLFPLSGKQKLLSKNLALAAVVLALFALLLPLIFLKLGTHASVLALLELVVVSLAYVSYGNWISVRQPFKMQFYRFASGGSAVDVLLGAIFGSIPVAVTVYLLYNDDAAALPKMGVMLLIYVGGFLFSLSRSGRIFESRREEIRRALS
jgi:hypothetical protein